MMVIGERIKPIYYKKTAFQVLGNGWLNKERQNKLVMWDTIARMARRVEELVLYADANVERAGNHFGGRCTAILTIKVFNE